ncbi:unnamed protein product, partial [Polarella glacialis]
MRRFVARSSRRCPEFQVTDTGMRHAASSIQPVSGVEAFPPQRKDCTAAISRCERDRMWAAALDLLLRQWPLLMQPDVVAFNSTMRACAKAQRPDLALRLLSQLRTARLGPDAFALDAAMGACARMGEWELALQLLVDMRQMAKVPAFTYGSALAACEKGSHWVEALHILREMHEVEALPNVVTYNTTISACKRGHQWAQSLEVLQAMRSHRSRPDSYSYSAAISACDRGQQWQLALALQSSMQRDGVRPSSVTAGALIGACSRGSQWELAAALLASSRAQKCDPGLVGFNATVSACARGSQWHLSLELLHRMSEDRLQPDLVSLNAGISACERGGAWTAALELLRKDLRPDVVTLNAAISACSEGQRWAAALLLFAGMRQSKVSPDLVSCNLRLQRRDERLRPGPALGAGAAAAWGEVSLMPGVGPPNLISYNTALAACERAGRWEAALDVLQRQASQPQSRQSLAPDVVTCGSLVAACARGQRWAQALDLLQDLCEERVRADLRAFGAAVSACERGLAELGSLPMCSVVISLIDGSRLKRKIDVYVCPMMPHLLKVKPVMQKMGISACAQNCSKTAEGAFTGEVSVGQLADARVDWTLVGHSERRAKYGESDQDVADKVEKALAAGLKVVVAIGESLEEREGGKTNEVNERQLAPVLKSIKVEEWSKIVIAYEPVWAIGTGKVATPDQAEETQAAIRAYIAKAVSDEVAEKVRIQYGGSVTPENCAELISKPNIDGFLVGGASLKASFMDIILKSIPPTPLKKPTFVSVKTLNPGSRGVNFMVKCTKAAAPAEGTEGVFEAQVGDDTGVVT